MSGLHSCIKPLTLLSSYAFYYNIVSHKPCQPRVSSSSIRTTTTTASFSWNACSRDIVASADRYLVSCDNSHISISSATVYDLSPNKQYSCYVYGIDSLGRLGTGAPVRFRTDMTGKLMCYTCMHVHDVTCS